MIRENEQDVLLRLGAEVRQLNETVQALAERSLKTSDRKFLFDLVTKFLKPGARTAQIGNGVVTLVAASQTIVEKNEARSVAIITNTGANAATLTLQEGAAVATQAVTLAANGGAFWFGRDTDVPYQGRVTGISNAAGTTLGFVEISRENETIEF
jgi:hypothetical protein